MKIKNKITILLLFVVGLMVGCKEDFLDRPPLGQITADNFYQTTGDLRLATAGLYGGKPWAEWNLSSYLPVGEVLSGNMAVGYWGDAVQLHTFTVTGTNELMIANWKSMYKIIAQCNVTIQAIEEKAPASIPEKDRNAAIAEARFIRGYAYYNLALLWGDVPIIEDNTQLIYSPLVNRNQAKDVFQFVVNDLRFAAQNLPLTDVAGRVTTWSAQGMLAKVYLTLAGLDAQGIGQRNQALLDSAQLYAGNVCKLSGLKLLPNYADLFKTKFNDNQESLFALQWAPGTGWLEGNMLQIYYSGSNEISAAGQSGWSRLSPTRDLYNQYAAADSNRLNATFMFQGHHYPELNAAGGGYTYLPKEPSMKKHIIGTNVDNSAPTMSLISSTEHNSLLRLADVYLLYAEAIMGNSTSTTDKDALFYYNLVHNRPREEDAKEDIKILHADTLFKERRIELAAEGHFWEDLVRLSYYNQPKAIDILNAQKRNVFEYDKGVVKDGDVFGIITPANSNTFKFPLPSSEVTANPKLLDTPVPYSF